MKIIVLVKQVPDPKHSVGLKPDGTIEREKAKSVMNPYDKNALEAALQIKDRQDAEITVISMGPPQAVEVLREAIAMGADGGVLLSDIKLAGSDTLATSYALSKAVEKVGEYDLILCGMETTDGNTGQVGPEIAEHLRIPQVTYVEELKIDGDFVEAKRLVEGGHEVLKTKLPALLTITNTANEPRFPSVMGVVAATKKAIPTWTIDDMGIDRSRVGLAGSPTKLKKIERPNVVCQCIIFSGEDLDVVMKDFLGKLKEDNISLGCKK